MKRTAVMSQLHRFVGALAVAVAVLGLGLAVAPARSATLSLVVLKKDGTPLQGAVITAEPDAVRLPPVAPADAIVDQEGLAFVPDVSVIPVGSTVAFPNSDLVSHQVYSFSPARRFQLPLYRGKQYPPVVFDQPGIVTLGCNIHDNMVAYVVVTSAPLFGRTDVKGAWVVPNAPEGTYHIKLWHPLLKEPTLMLDRTVRVSADGGDIQVKLDQSLRPAPLKGHPHSWDY